MGGELTWLLEGTCQHVQACMYTHRHAHTHTHARTRTHTHAQIHMNSCTHTPHTSTFRCFVISAQPNKTQLHLLFTPRLILCSLQVQLLQIMAIFHFQSWTARLQSDCEKTVLSCEMLRLNQHCHRYLPPRKVVGTRDTTNLRMCMNRSTNACREIAHWLTHRYMTQGLHRHRHTCVQQA